MARSKPVRESVEAVVSNGSGISLDIACGAHKQPGWTGMDILPLPGVDIIHDLNSHPWPLPDECANRAMASHIVEHIPPVAIGPQGTWFPFIEFMNEVWRVLKFDAEFAIACPHGYSPGYLQDPTHCNAINETTFAYFDPIAFDGFLYSFYRPKPWAIKLNVLGEPQLFSNPSGNIEAILVKRREDKSYNEGQ